MFPLTYKGLSLIALITVSSATPALSQSGAPGVGTSNPSGELVCNKGRWAKSGESSLEGIIADGLIRALSKRVCYGHVATSGEIDQILSHPIFNSGGKFFNAVSTRQKVATEARINAELRSALQRASPSERRELVSMAPSIRQRAIDQSGTSFAIKYADLDAFVLAQPSYRSSTRFLPSDLRSDVLQHGDQVFTNAYRSRVYKLAQVDKSRALGFVTSSSIVLGKNLPSCVKKTESVERTTIDRSGLPQNLKSEQDITVSSCFSLITDRTFTTLVSVREWHPFLWKKLSDEYEGWTRALSPSDRLKVAPVPAQLAVTQLPF